ncbi:MAG: hypothetical protein H7A45_13550 [Verrucomicrobiales bacterium]|nr:hypothetical protein [Verrucomicrobiales bacterium]
MKWPKRSDRNAPPEFRRGLGVLLTQLALATTSHAAEHTQTLTLQSGWNAVWLEVSPVVASGDDAGRASPVEEVFTDPDIDVVTRPVAPVGTAEFISDPSVTFNQAHWVVWNRNSTSGNTLTRIRGNQAYLIHNDGRSAVAQDVTGEVRFFKPSWAPGSYNLLGFGLSGSPTFAEFFGAAGQAGGVHPVSKIFTLDPSSGKWEGVQSTTPMAPGLAYWVFAERNSTFAGPVAIDFAGLGGLDFGTGPGDLILEDANESTLHLTTREITFSNVDSAEHTVTLSKVDPATAEPDADADDLRLYRVIPEPGVLDYTLETGRPVVSSALGTLATASTRTVTLGAERGWTSGDPSRENLYRLEVDLGSGVQTFWLPVTAARADLEGGTPGTPDPDYAGLWVGQANLTTVTSIAETGSPAVPTTSTLPIQIIIHVDGGGNPSLLSHVLFMQTKTADESVPAEPVLVVDEDKIPYFEGIAERGGRQVGRRIETAAYDMPLLYDASAQPVSLLTVIAEVHRYDDGKGNPDPTKVTDDDLAAYVRDAASRPAGFVEQYATSWPLDGGLGPGAIVRTADGAELVLDPYHRSNPFRHAFHPRHGTGIRITRAISITFDDTNADGLLTGTYTESLDGLTNLGVPLVASGPLTLRRVSDIGALN